MGIRSVDRGDERSTGLDHCSDASSETIPAVVHIEVTERQEVANPFLPLESNPLLRRFYHIPRLPKKVMREFMGLGSGILMDAQGEDVSQVLM